MKRKWRQVDGIVLLNKPLGLSSNQALQKVRRLYQAEKAGHTGALDPLATGMLPLCFGEATKFSQYLLDADKRYLTTVLLGVRTTTGDAEGEVLTHQSVPELSDEELEALLDNFRGAIEQTPPMYSALKHNGRPLYEYAREGITIERKRRQVTISTLRVVERTQNTITLDISCSKGTYIRTIGEDIGEALGCGAHLQALHRISSASYDPDNMISFERMEAAASQGEKVLDEYLLPLDSAVMHLNKVELAHFEASHMLHGRVITKKTSFDQDDLIRMYNEESNEFLGLGKIMGDEVKPHRLINTNKRGPK